MDRWRKLGPLGKLHNFVIHIGCTAQRKQQWKAISRGRNIARDNGTRWNSWYKMLGEAITLHKAVDRFFEQYPEKELDLDRLLAKDWTLLSNVSSSLPLLIFILMLRIGQRFSYKPRTYYQGSRIKPKYP